MPFGAQYNPQSPLLNIPRSPSSANPFDRSHAETFSSYGSLQGALLNMAARQGILRTSSLGNLSSQYITQYPAVQSPAVSSVAPPTADMHVVRQVPCNFSASGHTQRFPGYGGQGAAFISSNSDPELCRGSSQPSTPNSFTRAGNPFS
ncbi:hypothetical protein Syun_025922 [Stephania yunnanensis]|uniref:Uncharacterized protein n=1 Tax=Stephania yunnanensis TaxID=152371 RepID=A0AAP0HV89_9MAGN